MKKFFLSLLILNFASTPWAAADPSKAQKIAINMAIARCAEVGGLITEEEAVDFFADLSEHDIQRGDYKFMDYVRITSEESFADSVRYQMLDMGCQK